MLMPKRIVELRSLSARWDKDIGTYKNALDECLDVIEALQDEINRIAFIADHNAIECNNVEADRDKIIAAINKHKTDKLDDDTDGLRDKELWEYVNVR